MRFGKSAEEASTEPTRGGDYIRYLKDGDTTFRILQEPTTWTYYWEHFDPNGFSFPCDSENRDTCPGCTSENPKTKKASRKIAFNALQSYGGTDYVNVYKISNELKDRLENRFNKIGTLMDRDYTITKLKGSNDKVIWEIEGGAISQVDLKGLELKSIEEMLAVQFEENAGSPVMEDKPKLAEPVSISTWNSNSDEDPPSEPEEQSDVSEGEMVVPEDDLRKMDPRELKMMCVEQFEKLPPASKKTTDSIVDWMLQQS